MLTEPTAEMLAALQDFADRHGRYWKDTLSVLWGNGRDYYDRKGNDLHLVRNELGPSWLYDHCTIKPSRVAYEIVIRGRKVHYATAGDANQVANDMFKRTGVIVGITEVKRTSKNPPRWL